MQQVHVPRPLPPSSPQVAKHLTKLFDSMAQLKFQEGEEARVALSMRSKDGEDVDFDKSCECVGLVERWLNRYIAFPHQF